MHHQLAKEDRKGADAVIMDMRDEGLDFYAQLGHGMPLQFFCRGLCYKETPEGAFVLESADGTVMSIDEKEYRNRLEYALACIGDGSENGISELVTKHTKPL